MEKVYKIEVDCANCANKIERAINEVEGIKSAVINFMTQKLIVNFEENADVTSTMKNAFKCGKKIEGDFEIYM